MPGVPSVPQSQVQASRSARMMPSGGNALADMMRGRGSVSTMPGQFGRGGMIDSPAFYQGQSEGMAHPSAIGAATLGFGNGAFGSAIHRLDALGGGASGQMAPQDVIDHDRGIADAAATANPAAYYGGTLAGGAGSLAAGYGAARAGIGMGRIASGLMAPGMASAPNNILSLIMAAMAAAKGQPQR